ncbi:hypothetical protein PIL02S_06651, partial [Paenibacillus illinoisensis]
MKCDYEVLFPLLKIYRLNEAGWDWT